MPEIVSSPADAQTKISPLIVGVSGHRDLHPDCIGTASAAVQGFLEQLSSHSPDTEIRVVLGMAQGADLLVAQLALDRNLAVDAVLPMPLAQYAADFDADTLILLKKLLAHPNVRAVELPLPARPRGDAIVLSNERDALYANLSDYLMRKSSLLLALWDGIASPLIGGTADTVLRYLAARTDAGRDGENIRFVSERGDSVSETQFVYWIPIHRNGTEAGGALGQPCYLSGIGENLIHRHEQMPSELKLQLAELNDYNRAFQRLSASDSQLIPESLMAVIPEDTSADDRRSLAQIDAEYSKADALAVAYQRQSDRLFHLSSYLGAMIAMLFLIYAELAASELLLFGYMAILLSSIGLFYVVAERRWFSKHLVCRVLAETMRTKFFLRLAGADHLVTAKELIDLTGLNQFSGFSWISSVLRSVDNPEQGKQSEQRASGSELDSVHRAWIVGQHGYFKSKVEKLERNNRRLEQMKNLLIYIIVVVALVLIFFAGYLQRTMVFGISLEHWFVFLMGLLPVWLGIWELYQYKMATRELLWQYRNQLNHFSRAKLQLAQATAWNRKMQILADLGKASLMETYLWMIHRYHREHEPPASG